MIVTPRAQKYILTLKQKHPEWSDLPLRLYLCGKGCDGFTYGAMFDSPQRKDVFYPFEGFSCILSINANRVLSEAVVDFIDEGETIGFLITNPNHDQFRGKFWVKRTSKLVSDTLPGSADHHNH